jgi:hypothetical protein
MRASVLRRMMAGVSIKMSYWQSILRLWRDKIDF